MAVNPREFTVYVGGSKTEEEVASIQLQNLTGEVLLDAVRDPGHYNLSKAEALKRHARFLIERDRAASGRGNERSGG